MSTATVIDIHAPPKRRGRPPKLSTAGLPPLPGVLPPDANLPVPVEPDLPRDYSVIPPPDQPMSLQGAKPRGTYPLEPFIQPKPPLNTLTYIPDEAPVDYYALYDIERPTPSGQNKALYAPKCRKVALEDLDPNSPLAQAYALDRAIGEAWVNGQDSFLLEKGREFVPEEECRQNQQLTRSMQLAQREDFFGMCASSLWGKEAVEDKGHFADMLRGLIESWLPNNRWQLELLATMADLQWKIRRIRVLQKNVFQNGPGGHDQIGVPTNTTNAATLDEQLRVLQDQLERATRTYRSSVG